VDDGVYLHTIYYTYTGLTTYCTWYNQAMKRDLSKATPLVENSVTLGYLFPVNEEYWIPLDKNGEQLGPPTYRADAEAVIKQG